MLSRSCLKRNSVTTLYSVFKARVDATPHHEAFRTFNPTSKTWQSETWLSAYKQILNIRNALLAEKLETGDRILLTLKNSSEWVYIEQAALYLGLVVVALPPNMPPVKICKIINETDAKIVFIESDHIWHAVNSNPIIKSSNVPIICRQNHKNMNAVLYYTHWKSKAPIRRRTPKSPTINDNALATILYTSGTCGKPRGVRHSHRNLINNAYACLDRIDINEQDSMLSVTPISHCFERIAGYYVSIIAGASIIFPKSADSLLNDLRETKASILITTPHYLTRAYKRALTQFNRNIKRADEYLDYKHGNNHWHPAFLLWPVIRHLAITNIKKKLLHELRLVICGGAAVPTKVLRMIQAFNLPVLQGYGLTEAGGVISTNSFQYSKAGSVGKALNNTSIRISEENELLVSNDCQMLGYWDENPEIKQNKWLKTKDLAHITNDYIYIEGRKNRTIHLSTGDIILPMPIETELLQDPLFEQVFLHGENCEQLTLLCQINDHEWQFFLKKHNIHSKSTDITGDLNKILLLHTNVKLQSIPEQPKISSILPTLETWSQENNLLNALGKINKEAVEAFFAQQLNQIR